MAVAEDAADLPLAVAVAVEPVAEDAADPAVAAGKGDVMLHIGVPCQTIWGHKCVLEARSPVFAHMFAQEDSTRESFDKFQDLSDDGRPEIYEFVFEEFAPRAVRLMLRYMYGGDVPEMSLGKDEQVIDLMRAANWFCVQSLVDRCTQTLRRGERPARPSAAAS